MFARPRPAPFAVSLLTHGFILAWVASGPVFEKPKSLYARAIAPHADKLVWYDFRAKLPDVSPAAVRKPVKRPRVDVKIASQEIVAGARKAPRARQFVWQPAPKLEMHADLRSPNVLAMHVPRPEPPPKPRIFVSPPEQPKPAADVPAPALAAPPEIRTASNLTSVANVIGMRPTKAPPRNFVAPRGSHTADRQAPAPLLPDAPTLPAQASAPAVSMAIVGLSPSLNAPAPAPQGSRNAQFSAGPQPRPNGATDAPSSDAMLTVPGLLIRGEVPDAKPALMARVSPTSAANLRAALHGGLPAATIAGARPAAVRVSSAPDPQWRGRDTYAMSVQMPNITSYSGSWLIWFAQRLDAGPGGVLSPPVPLRKVDPKYFPAAMADRVEGKVRLAAVIRKDGSVDSVRLLQRLDDRLDQSAQEAMRKWEFEPALRDGQPVDVDAVVEIPFRLAPKVTR